MGSLGERCVDEIPFTSKEEDTCARIACDSSGLQCTLYVERVAMSQRKEIHRRSGWLVGWRARDRSSLSDPKIPGKLFAPPVLEFRLVV